MTTQAFAFQGPISLEAARAMALATIDRVLPGVGFASIPAAAKFLGVGEWTVRHMLAEGRCPVPAILVGGRRVVPIPALVDVLASALMGESIGPIVPAPVVVETDPTAPPKRGRGRPPKFAKRTAAEVSK